MWDGRGHVLTGTSTGMLCELVALSWHNLFTNISDTSDAAFARPYRVLHLWRRPFCPRLPGRCLSSNPRRCSVGS